MLDDTFDEDPDEEACEKDEDLSMKLPPPRGIERRKLFPQFDFGKNHGNQHYNRSETFGHESSSRNSFYRKV